MLSDDEFRVLLQYLDRPWAGYRKVRKGVKKRVRRHMANLGCTGIGDYLQALDRCPGLRAECESRLSVTISRFYRDNRLWRHMRRCCLPELAARFPGGVRAWSAGCAGGEEPYTLAMLWEELAECNAQCPALYILATDANPACLERARRGRYPLSSLKELPVTLRERWFGRVAGASQWRVNPKLQRYIRLQSHQLMAKPPKGPFHLILLRNNVLTYYQGMRLERALAGIVSTLSIGGILVTGARETLPPTPVRLEREQTCPWVYRLVA